MYKAKNGKKGKNGSENNRKLKKGAPKMAKIEKSPKATNDSKKGRKKEKDGRIAKTQPEPSNSNGKTQTSKKAGLPQVMAECQALVPGRVTGE